MAVPKTKSFRCRIPDVYGLHNGYNLLLRPGYTAIVGPNGAGKTTLLVQLEEIARRRDYQTFRYSNLEPGIGQARQIWMYRGKLDLFAASAMSSEGENIALAFGPIVQKIGRRVTEYIKSNTPLLILLDALDSGASVDRLRQLLDLFNLILKDAGILDNASPEHEIYIVAAVNSYELASRAVCVDPRTGKSRTFRDYTDYADFICSYPLTKRKEAPPCRTNNP